MVVGRRDGSVGMVPRSGTAFILVVNGLLAGCEVAPLTHRILVGSEAYVVFVGEGADGAADLFASPSVGGAVTQVTFTRAAESLPALAPDGKRVAFVRQAPGSAAAAEVVVLNLLDNRERRAPLPPNVGRVDRIAWRKDEHGLAIGTTSGALSWAVESGEKMIHRPTGGEAASVDSSLVVGLGNPVRAALVECIDGGLCVQAADGSNSPLTKDGRDGIRWGSDSVAYFVAEELEVRPLFGGRSRHIHWVSPPKHPRQATVYLPVSGPPSPP